MGTPANNTVRLNIVENNGMDDFFEIYYAPIIDAVFPDPEGTSHDSWVKNRYGSQMAAPGCVPESFDLEDVCALGNEGSITPKQTRQ
jgi:hypothetical protein